MVKTLPFYLMSDYGQGKLRLGLQRYTGQYMFSYGPLVTLAVAGRQPHGSASEHGQHAGQRTPRTATAQPYRSAPLSRHIVSPVSHRGPPRRRPPQPPRCYDNPSVSCIFDGPHRTPQRHAPIHHSSRPAAFLNRRRSSYGRRRAPHIIKINGERRVPGRPTPPARSLARHLAFNPNSVYVSAGWTRFQLAASRVNNLIRRRAARRMQIFVRRRLSSRYSRDR